MSVRLLEQGAQALDKDGLAVSTPDAIFTFSGIFIRPLDPDPDLIRIEDIAHALSMQCRWTGHVSRFYSVGEHCLGVAKLVPRHLRLQALLHDASEAYLADLARPIKRAPGLGKVYLRVEAKLEAAIAMRFGIDPDPLQNTIIKAADEDMLWAEAKLLLTRLGAMLPEPSAQAMEHVVGRSSAVVEAMFLRAFYRYGGVA